MSLLEQAFIIQCVIEEMETDTEVMKSIKGTQQRLDLKQVLGTKNPKKR